jgi:hypothetical protein
MTRQEKKIFFQMSTANPAGDLDALLAQDEQALYAPFFGSLGVTFAMIFTAAGSAYGTAKSGTGIASMAVARPDLVMKAIIPVVMAGKRRVIKIYFDCPKKIFWAPSSDLGIISAVI